MILVSRIVLSLLGALGAVYAGRSFDLVNRFDSSSYAYATFGIIVRPWNLPEFIWALAGAALLVVLQLLSWQQAVAAAAKGTDVYLFLIGMMLLAEVARKEGLVVDVRAA